MRHHIDRSTEIRRTDRRCRTWTAVEERLADELTREKCPRMVSRRIGIVERNTIEGHCVVAILETAEEGLAVSQARSVGSEAKRPRRHLDDFGIVRDRRGEILNVLRTNYRLRGTSIERTLRRRKRRCKRQEFRDDDFL